MPIEITPQERRFVALYIQAGKTNPAEAWTKAFRPFGKVLPLKDRVKNPRVEAARLLRTNRVIDEIAKQLEPLMQESRTGAARVLKELETIAYADRRELVTVRYINCRHCWGEDFLYQHTPNEYAELLARAIDRAVSMGKATPDTVPIKGGIGYDRLRPPHPDCPECRGCGQREIVIGDIDNLSEDGIAIYQGVEETKNGIKVVGVSKMDALKMLGLFWGITPETIKHILPASLKPAEVPVLPNDAVSAAEVYKRIMGGE